MNKHGAIFDLDGTLVDTVAMHTVAWVEMFERYGITLDERERKAHSGRHNIEFISEVLKRSNQSGTSVQELSDEKNTVVISKLKAGSAPVFAGAREFLESLKAKGVKIALATAATRSTGVLLAGDLLPLFDATVFAEDVDHGKPDPEIFLKAAKRIGLMPEDCIVFEDAVSGVQAAKAGGFFCAAKDNGIGTDLAGADVVVKEYHQKELMTFFA